MSDSETEMEFSTSEDSDLSSPVVSCEANVIPKETELKLENLKQLPILICTYEEPNYSDLVCTDCTGKMQKSPRTPKFNPYRCKPKPRERRSCPPGAGSQPNPPAAPSNTPDGSSKMTVSPKSACRPRPALKRKPVCRKKPVCRRKPKACRKPKKKKKCAKPKKSAKRRLSACSKLTLRTKKKKSKC